MRDVLAALRAAGVESFYPDFRNWLADKVLPGLVTGERFCLGAMNDGTLVGIAIGKVSGPERKLSTLWVEEGSRRAGFGESLAQAAFERLGTPTPLFTVPEEILPDFEGALRRWGFRLSAIRQDAYRPGAREYHFNGLASSP